MKDYWSFPSGNYIYIYNVYRKVTIKLDVIVKTQNENVKLNQDIENHKSKLENLINSINQLRNDGYEDTVSNVKLKTVAHNFSQSK